MKISILCSDEMHPVNLHLNKWINDNQENHDIELVRHKKDLSGGDILFLISCSEIITATDSLAYKFSLVVHASDLPKGRGWSPHIWQIINGAEEITLSLLEAEDKVDSGRIWAKVRLPVPKHALWDEINEKLFESEMSLMSYAVLNFQRVTPSEQDGTIEASYYRRRHPEDSMIDPSLSIAEQFNKIRICDPIRFPAFFELEGYKYKITLEKLND